MLPGTYIIRYDTTPLPTILFENFLLWSVLYTIAHLLLYVEPQRKLFAPFKFNPKYPPTKLVLKEIFRSARGVLICSLQMHGIYTLHDRGALPAFPGVGFLNPAGHANDLPLAHALAGALILYAWGDAHFYWTHRLLHTRWLFKNVHKVHHESFNPDPFSGLSMHWLESSIYFSAGPMICPFTPLWMSRVIMVGLLLFPLEGHHGHGTWEVEGSNNHYIHHSKFNWNYGSSPLWDHIMGTNYVPNATQSSVRERIRSLRECDNSDARARRSALVPRERAA